MKMHCSLETRISTFISHFSSSDIDTEKQQAVLGVKRKLHCNHSSFFGKAIM